MYCNMPKGTSWAKAMLNIEKVEYIPLAIVNLCFSEGIWQSVSPLVSQQKINFLKIPQQIFEKKLGRSDSLFGLSLPILPHHCVGN